MMQLEDLLRRLGPLVMPPGRAGPAPVPADRGTAVTDELVGLLAEIDRIDDEADRIVADARATADAQVVAAREQAAMLATDALTRAEAARAAGYADRRKEREAAIQERTATADAEIGRIRAEQPARIKRVGDALIDAVLKAAPE